MARITPLAPTKGAPAPGVPWQSSDAGVGNLWYGDYVNAMTGFGGQFFVMWADMRDSRIATTLFGATVSAT